VASVISSLRYLLADFIGEDDGARPFLPEGLPAAVVPVVSEGIDLLMEYQGSSYAQFYVDRVRRFVGRRGVDERMLGEIARLMALRMSYQDPIRVAQLKLMEFEAAVHGQRNATDDLLGIFRVDELIGALPAAIAEPVLDVLERLGWTHAPVSIRFSSKSRWGVRRLKIESSLRRWRLFSVRYAKERAWVERWLHMIGRSLEKQPAAAPAIIQTATMIQGYGDRYRQGLADWHEIIDRLVKPTFDGVLPIADLAAAVAEARAAAMADPRQLALKRTVGEIRTRAIAAKADAAAG
jgi:hypothetical protein